MVSISSDIWGEDGKSLLALMVHLIDSNFKLHNILIFAKPFSKISHTSINIEHAIKEALASYKIGEYDKTAAKSSDKIAQTSAKWQDNSLPCQHHPLE